MREKMLNIVIDIFAIIGVVAVVLVIVDAFFSRPKTTWPVDPL